MRLVVLCEGDTEKRVLKDFLAPYCDGFSRVEVQNTSGSGNLKNEFKDRAELELADDTDVVVFCLIDLLNSPFSFPREVIADHDVLHAKFRFIREFMEKRIATPFRDRFFAFPVVMELETWLLADPQALKSYFRTSAIKPWPDPESIREPTNELKNLMRRFRQTNYSKTLDGPSIFQQANAERVYDDACPHFVLLIDALKRVQDPKSVSSRVYFTPNSDLIQEAIQLQAQYESLWLDIEERDEITDAECALLDELEQQMQIMNERILSAYN